MSNGLVEKAREWVSVPTDDSPTPCPDCGEGELTEGYVRDPAFQSHWRGVRALECGECGYAERLE